MLVFFLQIAESKSEVKHLVHGHAHGTDSEVCSGTTFSKLACFLISPNNGYIKLFDHESYA